MQDSGHNIKLLPKRPEFQLKFNIEYVNIIKRNTNKTLEISKIKNVWNNVAYIIDNKENNNKNTMINDSDSEDEYSNNIEMLNTDINSDSE